jgi:hypothetical protein
MKKIFMLMPILAAAALSSCTSFSFIAPLPSAQSTTSTTVTKTSTVSTPTTQEAKVLAMLNKNGGKLYRAAYESSDSFYPAFTFISKGNQVFQLEGAVSFKNENGDLVDVEGQIAFTLGKISAATGSGHFNTIHSSTSFQTTVYTITRYTFDYTTGKASWSTSNKNEYASWTSMSTSQVITLVDTAMDVCVAGGCQWLQKQFVANGVGNLA